MSPLPFHIKRVTGAAPIVEPTGIEIVAPDLVVVDLPAPVRLAAAMVTAIELKRREEESAVFSPALYGTGIC